MSSSLTFFEGQTYLHVTKTQYYLLNILPTLGNDQKNVVFLRQNNLCKLCHRGTPKLELHFNLCSSIEDIHA